ncbi:LysR substrate-binding domain-containing protein [Halomonas sp. GXIMD04776]|uniref:LysR family transcriptional regulator n=1 Tax=Halomonas sp. GXIMD04776 TaxID=3415605 RepID=UPI003CBD7504
MIINDLTDARILAELRNRLSFVDTARALKLPAATLSRRVAGMEQRAGLRLFERSSRVVRITEAGLVAANHALQLLSEAETVDLRLDNLRDKPSGTIRISAPVIFGQAIFGSVVTDFLNRYPDCDLDIALSDRRVDLVEENVDVVVRIGPPENDDLIARSLGTAHAGLYQSALAVNEQSMPTTVDGLRDFRLGLLHAGFGQTPELGLTSETGEGRKVAITPKLVCMNPWLLKAAALSSDMIVVLPDIVAQADVDEGRLQRVLPRWFARRVPVHLAFTSRRLMRPAVRAFVDYAVSVIPAELLRARK